MKNDPNTKEVSEVAQIVVQPLFGNSLILRYRKVDTAKKVYADLVKRWRALDGIVKASSDMFDSSIDLSQVVCISLVDHAKRAKFIPIG